jgi:hypothetical protein
MGFAEVALEKGLTIPESGVYEYADSISCIKYEQLTAASEGEIPYYGVFAKPLGENQEYRFGGFVSDLYDFEGNDIMINRIKQSISDVAVPIFQESHYMNWPRYTSMSKEIIIQNAQSDPRVGDIYPHIAVRNTYDGRGSKEVTFGLSMYEAGTRNRIYGFTFSLCSMKQMHHEHARSRIASNIGGYLQAFSSNIKDLITANFGAQVQEDSLLSLLDVVEKIGKRRREEVSTYLADLKKQNSNITAWDLFLAITRFSTIEKNLNAKLLMENIAERVLVLPVELERALKTLRSRGR